MCIYIYIYIHVYIYIYIYIYVYVYNAFTHTHAGAFTQTYVYITVYIYIYIYMYTHTHKYTIDTHTCRNETCLKERLCGTLHHGTLAHVKRSRMLHFTLGGGGGARPSMEKKKVGNAIRLE
jgi:hypothetical protein